MLTLLASVPVRAATLSEFEVGVWWGGAYDRDDNGTFDHCTADAQYGQHVFMFVSVDRNGKWALGLQDDRWRFELGSKVPVRFRIDAGGWYEAAGLAAWRDRFQIFLPDDPGLLGLLRRGNVIEWAVDDKSHKLRLGGTSRLIPRLDECLQEQLALEVVPTAAADVDDADDAAGIPPSDNGSTEGDLSTGSGFIVAEAGYLVTNHHVVQECRRIVVGLPGEPLDDGRLVASDPANDLALLKVERRFDSDEIAVFRVGSAVQSGERIAVFGFPMAGILSPTGNLVSGNVSALAGIDGDASRYQISVPIQPGNSGGPLLDLSGFVVGVVSGKLNDLAWARLSGDIAQNVNFGIKGAVVRNFLNTHNVGYRTASKASALDLVAVGERARKYTALIVCRN